MRIRPWLRTCETLSVSKLRKKWNTTMHILKTWKKLYKDVRWNCPLIQQDSHPRHKPHARKGESNVICARTERLPSTPIRVKGHQSVSIDFIVISCLMEISFCPMIHHTQEGIFPLRNSEQILPKKSCQTSMMSLMFCVTQSLLLLQQADKSMPWRLVA